jgi:arylsulfatase A-like enzyme
MPTLLNLLLITLALTSTTPATPARPNIVIILADDMGYGDPQPYNPQSTIPTPNLTRLAQEGMLFTDAHSPSAVCTPTRYGLLTGRYAWRTRLKNGVLFPPNDPPLIETNRTTLPQLLQQQGYTTACVGKWHLGIDWARNTNDEVDFDQPFRHGPNEAGFDEFFGIAGSLDMVPYGFYRNHHPVQPFTTNQPAQPFPQFVREGPRAPDFRPDEVLDRLTAEATNFIQSASTSTKPFFLYLALTAPHKPTWPAQRFRNKTQLGPYADFVHQTDWSVGQILNTLDSTSTTSNTLLFFTSDNGSYMYRRPNHLPDHSNDASIHGYAPKNHQPNGPWRGTKADIFEAGHRIPLLVRWPHQITPKSSSHQTVCLTDLFATCADILNVSLTQDTAPDSTSLLPLLTQTSTRFERPPVIHHSVNGTFSIRQGPWKLILSNGSGGREQPAGKPFAPPHQLYNLTTDPTESTNTILQFPEITSQLSNAFYSTYP